MAGLCKTTVVYDGKAVFLAVSLAPWPCTIQSRKLSESHSDRDAGNNNRSSNHFKITTLINESLSELLGESADPIAAGYHLQQLAQAGPESALLLAVSMASQSEQLAQSDPAIVGALLRVLHTLMLRGHRAEAIDKLDPAIVPLIKASLPKQTPNRHLLLHLLAMQQTAPSLILLVQLLKQDPPKTWVEAAQVISPLMQRDDWPVDAVFPEILDCLPYPSLASPVLDLANYLTREGRIAQHPGADQLPALNHLLGEVSRRLARFEENPREFGDDVPTVQNTLSEAVALAVSLCDAVALIGDQSSIGKLNQAIELRHRRVQCEAAGALAKLGDEPGKQRLIELAAEPAARLRAIHYADELGFGDLIDPEYRADNATAEAELALWLTQPQQMGVPPTSVEVIDSRHVLWPSFHDPIDVFLVRFEYNFGDRQYSNVGMTGPAAYAMSADVADLPIEDIYAIYAGWQAEHDEIFTVAADQFNEAQLRTMVPFQHHLERMGYASLKPAMLGFFLDEQAGIFQGIRDDTECLVVTDGSETIEQPTAGRLRPLGPGDLFNLYKGRKMLRTFNP